LSKRLRDPVHGLIVFDDSEPVDLLALQLIETAEFQRLRRIRQLGVSEFTFPGAVHTRFAHSIGVFHTARQLVQVINREMRRIGKPPEPKKADVSLIAALLHDLGHGPFSHTFESAQRWRGVAKRHEQWTAEMIRCETGGIRLLLEGHRPGFTEEVAGLLEKEDPEDIYHAVVSSSFDADRLDYLRRDKLMTGTGAGGIDFDWLIDNVRVAEIAIDAPDAGGAESRRVPTFCLTAKALLAAEQFLLSRYTLYQQVYFHKTTRCVEHMIGKLLRAVAQATTHRRSAAKVTGLSTEHPLIRFFAADGATVANYTALDDMLVYGSLCAMMEATNPVIRDMATRLRGRNLYKTLDVADFGADRGTQTARRRWIVDRFKAKLKEETVILDEEAGIGIYAEVGGDEERMHKKLHILDGDRPVEISVLSPLIKALEGRRSLTRFYFAERADRDEARQLGAKR
jgi:hypothetical protein